MFRRAAGALVRAGARGLRSSCAPAMAKEATERAETTEAQKKFLDLFKANAPSTLTPPAFATDFLSKKASGLMWELPRGLPWCCLDGRGRG